MKNKLTKQNIILLIILVIIIVLVVVLAVRSNSSRKKQTTTRVPSTFSQSETEYTGDSDLTEAPNAELERSRKAYAGKKNVLKINGEPQNQTGVWFTVLNEISPKKQGYYFTEGIYDPKFTGVTYDAFITNETLYYVKNGKVDTNFNGLASYNNYLRVFKHGVCSHNFNGTLIWTDDGTESNIKNGAVYGSELGRPDGWVYPNNHWKIES